MNSSSSATRAKKIVKIFNHETVFWVTSQDMWEKVNNKVSQKQGQFSDFQFLILILKISFGKSFKIFGPKKELLSVPWYTVLLGPE